MTALPKWIERVIALVAWPGDADSILADLSVELADRRAQHGHARACRWLVSHVARSAVPLAGRRVNGLLKASAGGRGMWHRGIGLDLQHVGRRLRRAPGFTALAVGMLGIGLGATASVFALAYALWLKPLPYRAPQELVSIVAVQDVSQMRAGSSGAEMADVAAGVPSLAGVAGFHYGAIFARLADGPMRLVAYPSSRNLFSVLGVQAAMGRTFSPDDDGQNIVVSDAFWRNHLGAAPNIVGLQITADQKSYTIIGVMPRGFRFPLTLEADAWMPTLAPDGDRTQRYTNLVARLRPGATRAGVNLELKTLSASLARALPASNAKWTLQAEDLEGQPSASYQAAFGALLAMVGLFLVIACANLASLFVARNLARRTEMTVALAIGASRWRLARALLLETAVVAALGVAVAIALTSQALHVFALWMPPGTPRLGDVGIDGSVLLFTGAAAVLTAALCALAPMAGLRSLHLSEVLSGTRGAGATSSPGQQTLVVVEIALAAVLVIGGTAMVQSFSALLNRDRGFAPVGVATLTLTLPFDLVQLESADARADIFTRMIESVRAVPGVTSAGAATGFPGSALGILGAGAVTRPGRTDPPVVAGLHNATPDYFRAIGVPLKKGRAFTAADRIGSPRVVIISEALEKQLWPDGQSLGQHFKTPPAGGLDIGAESEAEVVGVVGDMHLGTRRTSDIFVPLAQVPSFWADLVVRTSGDPTALMAPIRAAVRRAYPEVIVENVSPLQTIISNVYGLQRAQSFLTALVAAFGGLIALLGLYALLDQHVARRAREMGIRLALGSSPRQLFWQVFLRGMRLAAVGISVGVAVAVLAMRLWRDQVFGLQSAGGWILTGAAFAVGAACALVIASSARRVIGIDPVESMRQA